MAPPQRGTMSDNREERVRAGPVAGDAALLRPCEARGCRACTAALATEPATGPTGGGPPGQHSDAPRVEAEPVGVAVVDDNKDFRRLVLGVLQTSPEFQCFGCFSTTAEALNAIPKLPVRIVLVGLSLPDLCGIELIQSLRLLRPGLRVVLMAPAGVDPAILGRALAAGADWCCVEPLRGACCLLALRLLAIRLSPARLGSRLTERQERVMACLAQGLYYKEIQDKLGLSQSAVKRLQHKAYQSLGAANRTEALMKWRPRAGPG